MQQVLGHEAIVQRLGTRLVRVRVRAGVRGRARARVGLGLG